MSYKPPAANMRRIKAEAREAQSIAEAASIPEPEVPAQEPEAPLIPEYHSKMKKADLLAVAATLSLLVSEENTKAEILAALDAATGK